jgi:hypothetical protein
MTTEKNQIQVKVLQEKLSYIDHQLNNLDFIDSSTEQTELLLKIKDEILSELLYHKIQRQFQIIEAQNKKE